MTLVPAADDGGSLATLFHVDEVERARAYRAAQGHSRLVRIARAALPIGLLAALAGLAFVTYAPWRALEPAQLSFDSISADGSSMTMARPRLSGYRRDGRPFSLTAAKAMQDLAHPTQAALTQVSGQMAVSDALSLKLAAGAGLYDNSTLRLSVKDKVTLTSDTFALALDAADIDFRNGTMASAGPVLVTRPDGSQIQSDSFAAADNGRQLTFLGHVRTTVQPADPAADGGKP
jgi:lipopolysaccharide export system protein LptC